MDVAGEDVADLYAAGKLDVILDYNKTDAVTTHLLMLRIELHAGLLLEEEYVAEIRALKALIGREMEKGSKQLARYAEVWHSGGYVEESLEMEPFDVPRVPREPVWMEAPSEIPW